jgi:hypothetical protein
MHQPSLDQSAVEQEPLRSGATEALVAEECLDEFDGETDAWDENGEINSAATTSSSSSNLARSNNNNSETNTDHGTIPRTPLVQQPHLTGALGSRPLTNNRTLLTPLRYAFSFYISVVCRFVGLFFCLFFFFCSV